MDLESMDPKQKALIALTAAAQAFLDVTNSELESKFPGRGAHNEQLLNDGKAHLAISIQAGSGQVKAALALVQPEFVKTLEAPELELHGSLKAIFSDPEKLQMVDLQKLN